MKAKLKEDMKLAMKAREKEKLQGIRSLLSAIQYEEMQKGVEELGEQAILAVLKTELKKRYESLEFAEKAERPEEIAGLKVEIAYIESLLPAQMSEDQLEKVIREITKNNQNPNLGSVMKALKEDFADQYDGKLASAVAKRVLEA